MGLQERPTSGTQGLPLCCSALSDGPAAILLDSASWTPGPPVTYHSAVALTPAARGGVPPAGSQSTAATTTPGFRHGGIHSGLQLTGCMYIHAPQTFDTPSKRGQKDHVH